MATTQAQIVKLVVSMNQTQSQHSLELFAQIITNPTIDLVKVEILYSEEDFPAIDVVGSSLVIETKEVKPLVDLHVSHNDEVIVHSLYAHGIDLIDSHASHDSTLNELIALLFLPFNFTCIACSDCTNGSYSSCVEITVATCIEDVEPVVAM
ncbi:hypothetical protein RJT34_15191 [Clitoria ternatea]|uniref:Uncharacterized protein n=1 Tax=Clitoria ternatea TaxID=43366 RepID=A0AAN9JU80_CLITE